MRRSRRALRSARRGGPGPHRRAPQRRRRRLGMKAETGRGGGPTRSTQTCAHTSPCIRRDPASHLADAGQGAPPVRGRDAGRRARKLRGRARGHAPGEGRDDPLADGGRQGERLLGGPSRPSCARRQDPQHRKTRRAQDRPQTPATEANGPSAPADTATGGRSIAEAKVSNAQIVQSIIERGIE